MVKLTFKNPNLPLIGVNGRFLIAQRTGVQRSAYRLFRGVVDRGHNYNFVFFTGESEAIAEEWKRDNVCIVPSRLSSQSITKNYLWEQIWLPYLARKYRVRLLHNPANLAPLLFAKKSVVNIHDLCFLVEPSWFSMSFRLIYSKLIPMIAARAAMVITNSNYSKNDILEYLPVSLQRVRMSYWAADPLFHTGTPVPYENRDDRILYVGSIEPRKNLAGLLAAFNLFRKKNPDSRTKLTLIGCENSLFAAQVFDLGDFHRDIEFLGYMSDADLSALYRRSRMLVYPSFYEGFGFPPLEAMASGTPVITSWNSSLPEVVGDCALLVNPLDPKDIADKIETYFRNPDLARQYIENGLQRVKIFSWDRVAEHTLQIYDELLLSMGTLRIPE